MLDERAALLDVEFMDSKRFWSSDDELTFKQHLQAKLRRLPPYQCILSADDNALLFIDKYQTELFPSIPIVFFGVNDVPLAYAQQSNPWITGVVEAVSMQETIELALRLQPGLKQIVALTDDTPSGQGDLKTFYQYADAYPTIHLRDISLARMTFDQMDRALEALPEHSCVLLLSAYHDKVGHSLQFSESLERILAHSRRPVYHLWEHGLEQGMLGGKVISHYEQGRQAALLTRRILNGERIAALPIITESPNRYIFNSHTLERFGIDKRRLPKGSMVMLEPQSLWQKHHHLLLTIFCTIIGLTACLVFMLGVITHLRRTKEALRQSKDELALKSNLSLLMLTSDEQTVHAQMLGSILQALSSQTGYIAWLSETGALQCLSVQDDLWPCAAPTAKSCSVCAGLTQEKWRGMWGQSLLKKKTICSNKAFWFHKGSKRLRNALAVPIMDHGELLGQIFVANTPKAYRRKDIILLESICNQIAPVLGAMQTRKRHEQERQRNQAQLQRLISAIEQAAEYIVIVDAQGLIQYVNPAFESITGYTRAQVIGQPISILQVVEEDEVYERSIWSDLKQGLRVRRASTQPAPGRFGGRDGSLHRPHPGL